MVVLYDYYYFERTRNNEKQLYIADFVESLLSLLTMCTDDIKVSIKEVEFSR